MSDEQTGVPNPTQAHAQSQHGHVHNHSHENAQHHAQNHNQIVPFSTDTHPGSSFQLPEIPQDQYPGTPLPPPPPPAPQSIPYPPNGAYPSGAFPQPNFADTAPPNVSSYNYAPHTNSFQSHTSQFPTQPNFPPPNSAPYTPYRDGSSAYIHQCSPTSRAYQQGAQLYSAQAGGPIPQPQGLPLSPGVGTQHNLPQYSTTLAANLLARPLPSVITQLLEKRPIPPTVPKRMENQEHFPVLNQPNNVVSWIDNLLEAAVLNGWSVAHILLATPRELNKTAAGSRVVSNLKALESVLMSTQLRSCVRWRISLLTRTPLGM